MIGRSFGSDATVAAVLAWKQLPPALRVALRGSRVAGSVPFLDCIRKGREPRFRALSTVLLAHDVGLQLGARALSIVGHHEDLSKLTAVFIPPLVAGEHLGLARRGGVIAAAFVSDWGTFLFVARRSRGPAPRTIGKVTAAELPAVRAALRQPSPRPSPPRGEGGR